MKYMANSFPLPYYAVIFISQKNTSDPAFDVVQRQVTKLVQAQKGFLGMDRYRTPEGLGFSISYWESLIDMQNWRNEPTHSGAQKAAIDRWYSEYVIRICKVERDTAFINPKMESQINTPPVSRSDFYIDDHAFLYGVIAKSIENCCDAKGVEVCRKIVKLMARERGIRSAMRCLADGGILNTENYLIYGEILDDKGWNVSEIFSFAPAYETHTTGCGWANIWKKYNFERQGAWYCKEIDSNLVYGFNPKLQLEMNDIIMQGSLYCSFSWKQCQFSNKDDLQALMEKRKLLAPHATKDFLYHCGHLLSVAIRVLRYSKGIQETNMIISQAFESYENQFSKEKALLIRDEFEQNFFTI